MKVLDDLRKGGLIESVSSDPVAVAGWLTDAERHLEAAKAIEELDPSGAYILAYDAARKSVAAALLTAGFRVLSRPGSHQALARYADSLAARTNETALKRLDRMRRNRNRSEYGSRTFGKAEVAEAIDTADSIRAACANLI